MLDVGAFDLAVFVGPVDTGSLIKDRAFVTERLDHGRTSTTREEIELRGRTVEVTVVIEGTESSDNLVVRPSDQLHEVRGSQKAVLADVPKDGEIVFGQSQRGRSKAFEPRAARGLIK